VVGKDIEVVAVGDIVPADNLGYLLNMIQHREGSMARFHRVNLLRIKPKTMF
jgi:hypothetical protein